MYSFLHKIDWVELNKESIESKNGKEFNIKIARHLGSKHKLFMDTVFDVLASVTPIKVEDKYSATATFAAIPDIVQTPYYNFTKEQFRGYFTLVTKATPSSWISGTVGGNPNYSTLVPIMLAAYKMKLGIPYEAWDFSDPAMKHMMNAKLYELIGYRDVDFSGINKKQIRDDVLYVKKSGDFYSATRYPTSKKVSITNDIIISSVHPLALMLSQVWCANVAKRTEYMVLDPNNWDAMPEAMDEVINSEKSEKSTKPEYKAPF